MGYSSGWRRKDDKSGKRRSRKNRFPSLDSTTTEEEEDTSSSSSGYSSEDSSTSEDGGNDSSSNGKSALTNSQHQLLDKLREQKGKIKSLTTNIFESQSWKRLDKTRRFGKKKLGVARMEFLESKEFVDMVNLAFDECDIDGGGTIDAPELYAGVLLLYHNINKISLGGRKPPPKRAQVMKVMHKYDFDNSGTLDRLEFLALCQDLCQDIARDFTRRMFLVLIVFPAIALPIKRLFESVQALNYAISHIPDHIFTSAMVAIMVTILPYFEARFNAEETWKAVESEQHKQVKSFKKERLRELEDLKLRKSHIVHSQHKSSHHHHHHHGSKSKHKHS